MARHSFGGDISAWVFTAGVSNVATLAPGVAVTFWTAKTGGTQYLDLSTAADGSGPISQVLTGDGTTNPAGDIPVFYGPDNIVAMWASANAGPRKLMLATDVLSDVMTLAGAQTITGTKTFHTGDAGTTRAVFSANATGQTADLWQAWSGTDTGQGGTTQKTTYLNEKGELRVISAKANSTAVRIKGQPSQTANVLEQTDTSNNAVSWWAPDGSWRAPNLGHTLAMSVSGNLVVGAGQHRIYNDTGVPLIIRSVRASVGTAPSGASVIVDINKNGSTIFTTQGNRPAITAGSFTSGRVENANVTSLANGEYLTVDIDQIGSVVAGADLVVQILAY